MKELPSMYHSSINKEINKTMPEYKYVKKIIVTDEELVKTTTQKIKRHEEMKKIQKNA